MLFNSLTYLIFFIIVIILYYLCPNKYKHFLLLIASYIFYMVWNVKLIFLMLGVSLIAFCSGLLMAKMPKHRKLFCILGIVMLVAILFYFKYINFFIEIISDIFNMKDYSLSVILPIGISFYIFQALSYIIDTYRDSSSYEKNIFYFALYISFFPQLVAGPIERHKDLIGQFKEEHKFAVSNLSEGLKMMVIGFFKKIAIADIIGIYVNKTFNDINSANGLIVVCASLLFAVQIVCDFSGYCDIAIGSAKCLGINLSKNFDKPYLSTSIKEFWNSWHITLSKWLKDYIYIPLGGNKKSKIRAIINILIVFLISGLWHGASYTFLLWGLLHGIYRIIGEGISKLHFNIPKAIKIISCFILVDIAWIIFRSNSIHDMGIAFQKIFIDFSLTNNSLQYLISFFNMNWWNFIYIVSGIIILIIISKLIVLGKYKWFNYICTMIIIWITIGAFIYLQTQDISTSFIYFQF